MGNSLTDKNGFHNKSKRSIKHSIKNGLQRRRLHIRARRQTQLHPRIHRASGLATRSKVHPAIKTGEGI